MDGTIPAALVAATRRMLHDDHDDLRRILGEIGPAALDWRPDPEANPVAVLVAHSLDAERFLVAAAADVEVDRDREAQFRVRGIAAAELLGLVDRIEAEVDGYLDRVTAETLVRPVARPGRVHDGTWWLLHAVEHTREHVGQAALTVQLFRAASGHG
jgi:hypothetical protein